MGNKIHDVIIIGAGPAGIACAIQLKRSGINPLVFEKENPGGLLYNANMVENYPGFPSGISGYNLAELLKKHLRSEKIKTIKKTAIRARFVNSKFIIETSEDIYRSGILVIAAGTEPKLLTSKMHSPASAKRIFYDLNGLRNSVNKNILIIGAGDLAFDYALNLGHKNKITLINRSASVNCLPLLFKRAMKLSRFEYLNNTYAENIIMGMAKQLTVDLMQNGKRTVINADCILAAIGRIPVKPLLPAVLSGKLVQERKLFIIGDAANKHYRQASIAAGDGVRTAMVINELLKDGNENYQD